MTCTTCRYFHDGDCRESPPVLYSFLAPVQSTSIMRGSRDIEMALHVQCSYPKPDPNKPCGKHREVDN
ncbi:MAG TPA: hypothetical protein VMT56_00270 [Candidatus Bathyarchaeia archaeon]|nr:hypothetical protein [Candidatus Bathyarchaeia archaeon]